VSITSRPLSGYLQATFPFTSDIIPLTSGVVHVAVPPPRSVAQRAQRHHAPACWSLVDTDV
jgi:hypothetical protein